MESLAKIQAKREAKKDRREKRKKELGKLSQARLDKRGAPSQKVTEAEHLQTRMQVADLTRAVNQHSEALQRLSRQQLEEKALEAHYMVQVMAGLLVERGLCSRQELEDLCRIVQEKDQGLVPKENGIVEMGDLMLMRHRLYRPDGQLLDDQSQSTLAYPVGSGGLPCEAGLLGMREGEERSLEAVFGPGFSFAEYIGVPLRMQVTCLGVRTQEGFLANG